MTTSGQFRSAELEPFGYRLSHAMQTLAPVCVGLDPHPQLLAQWGLPDTVSGLAEFAERCTQAWAGQVAVVKPQSAFYERHGSAGMAVLEKLLADFASTQTLTIVDAKRGDIGSTNEGYADTYFRPGAPLATDALTITPYVGFDALAPLLDAAECHGRGVFVLCLTSNPEGAAVQRIGGSGSIARVIAESAQKRNEAFLATQAQTETLSTAMGSIGLVVGATIGELAAELDMDFSTVRGPLLIPGLGAQGGHISDVRKMLPGAEHCALVSSSRAVLAAGPDPEDLRRAALAWSEEVSAGLGFR